MADKNGSAKGPITIKKYANRRLYNTATSSYVTLDHLAQMVKDGKEFIVTDAKTGEDITRSVLTQIIVEEESKGGQSMLPIGFLRQLIGFYGDSLQAVLPRYLEHSMQSFSHNQERMRQHMRNTLGGFFPFNAFEELGKQNMALFESAMKMFNPGAAKPAGDDEPTAPPAGPAASGGGDSGQVDELRKQLERMQRQLNELTAGSRRSD